MLTNVEVWYGLTNSEIEEFEILDRALLRKILGLPKSTPSEVLYLETGCLNIATIVKCRRLNFLHYLVKSNKNSMLSHFFETQYNFPAQDDWTVEARKNLNEFGIPENLEYIGGHSKETFKILVKKQARIYAYNLFIQKKEGHSKLKNLDYQELKTQNYLLCQEMTVIQLKYC